MSVYVGIDVYRKRSQVAVIDQDGEVLANRNVPNGAETILGVIGGLPPGTPAAFGAAFGWGWLVEVLEDYGFEPHLVHPLRCKAIASGSAARASSPPGPGSPRPSAAQTAPSATAASASKARPGCGGSCARPRRPPSGTRSSAAARHRPARPPSPAPSRAPAAPGAPAGPRPRDSTKPGSCKESQQNSPTQPDDTKSPGQISSRS
jgi:hypothetical protein